MAIKKLRQRGDKRTFQEKLEDALEYVNIQRVAFNGATTERTKNWFYEEFADFLWRAFNCSELATGLKSRKRIEEENKWLKQNKKMAGLNPATADHPYTRKRAAKDFFSIPISNFPMTEKDLEEFLRQKAFTIALTPDENQKIRSDLESGRAESWIDAYASAGIQVYEWETIHGPGRGRPTQSIKAIREVSREELEQLAN